MLEIDQAKLWNEPREGVDYPKWEKWHTHLLDQYKLYVEMADRVSQRRTSANNYFLSVNSAILAFVGYLTTKDSTDFLWTMAIAGVALTVLWRASVVSYRNLNTAKWQVVHEIEKRLPMSPYDAEWEAVNRGTDRRLYWPTSHIEAGVPWVFLALHVVVFFRTFPFQQVLHFVKFV